MTFWKSNTRGPISFRRAGFQLGLATALLLDSLSFAEDSSSLSGPSFRALVAEHCFDCHDADSTKGDLNLEAISSQPTSQHSEIWEKVVRRLRARQMPPAGKNRLDEATYNTLLSELEGSLEKLAAQHPQPGRIDTLRRLNRTEYQNAIRDLLALDIAATTSPLSCGFAYGRVPPRVAIV